MKIESRRTLVKPAVTYAKFHMTLCVQVSINWTQYKEKAEATQPVVYFI